MGDFFPGRNLVSVWVLWERKKNLYDCHTSVRCASLSASHPVSDSATGGTITSAPKASRLMLLSPLLSARWLHQFWQDRSVLRRLRQIWTRSSGLWFKDHAGGQKEKDMPVFFLKVSSLQKILSRNGASINCMPAKDTSGECLADSRYKSANWLALKYTLCLKLSVWISSKDT